MKTIIVLVSMVFLLALVGCKAVPEVTVDPKDDTPVAEVPVEEPPIEEPPTEEPPIEEPPTEEPPVEEPPAEEPPVEEPPVEEYVYDSVLSQLLHVRIDDEQVDAIGSNINFINNGITELDDSFITNLGIDLSGTDKEIADGILDWQKNNMIYASSVLTYKDVSFGMRWSYIFPGLYTVDDIFERQTDGDMYYGVCYHYAQVFASIANYYGLTVRIAIANEKQSDFSDDAFSMATQRGMSGEEYNAFAEFIVGKGYDLEDFPYEVVRLLMVESSTHYRAEVLIDGVWEAYDKYNEIIASEGESLTYGYDKWLDGYNPSYYTELMDRLAAGESLLNEGYPDAYAQFLEARVIATDSSGLPGTGMAYDYEGITDDLGQLNRAANVEDIMNGLALAPYFDTQEKILDFFGNPNWLLEEIEDVMFVIEEIEDITGKPYYAVAEIMTWGEDDITDPELFVEQYEGFSGATFNINLWEDYVE